MEQKLLNYLTLLTLCDYSLADATTYTFTPFLKAYTAPLISASPATTAGQTIYTTTPFTFVKSVPLLATYPNTANRFGKTESSPLHYGFNYHVHDPLTGDIKHHRESRSGGNTVGSYSILDADGFKRTVTYTADDKNGFNAVVQRETLMKNTAPGMVITFHHAAVVKSDAIHATPFALAAEIADAAAVPAGQTWPFLTATDPIYHQQILDLPLKQPNEVLSLVATAHPQQQQQQQQQYETEIQAVQMVSDNESSSNEYHQSQEEQKQQQEQQQQHQHQQYYLEDQQFAAPYPQKLQQQPEIEDGNDDDDSEVVEARFHSK